MHMQYFEFLQKLGHIVSNFVKTTQVLQSVFSLLGTCYCLNDVEKKKEQTSEQGFVNAVIKIWMPLMNSMIHWKTSFECLR